MGVPVWFFKPLHEAPSYCVDALADMEHPQIHLPLKPLQLKFPPIFTGAANQTAKYWAMERFTRDHIHWADPFSLPRPDVFASFYPPPPLTTHKDVRFTPCTFRLLELFLF